MRAQRCKGTKDLSPEEMRGFRLIEGIFRDHKVQCSIEEDNAMHMSFIILKMQPNNAPHWIDSRWIDWKLLNKKPQALYMGRKFKQENVISVLESLKEFCEKIESGEFKAKWK